MYICEPGFETGDMLWFTSNWIKHVKFKYLQAMYKAAYIETEGIGRFLNHCGKEAGMCNNYLRNWAF